MSEVDPSPSTHRSSGWLSWSYWMGGPSRQPTTHVDEIAPGPSHAVPVEEKPVQEVTSHESESEDISTQTGWDRIRRIYSTNSMEYDVMTRVTRMTFLGGFLMGGATGYAQARQTYELNNVGRKYLSPSDAVKRRVDYAILRFAKGGFGMGLKCAFITGSIVGLTTHISAYRNQFASWYFPALSALVGGVFAFPLGVIGSAKAFGLGLSSGLTLTAVVHLYAMSIDKTTDEAYWSFKKEYEKELRVAEEWDRRVTDLMTAEGIRWRQTAVKRLKAADEQKLTTHDA